MPHQHLPKTVTVVTAMCLSQLLYGNFHIKKILEITRNYIHSPTTAFTLPKIETFPCTYGFAVMWHETATLFTYSTKSLFLLVKKNQPD